MIQSTALGYFDQGYFGAVKKPPVKKVVAVKKATTKKVVVAVKKVAAKLAPNPAVRSLQQAINSFALRSGDKSLTLAADGLIGPKTVATVNRLLPRIAGAPPALSTGRLTLSQVVASAPSITIFVNAAKAVKPATRAAAKAVAVQAVKKTAAAAAKTSSAAVASLQQSLVALGRATGNATLKAIKVDGLIGPKTIAAANLALSKYVANAPAAYRTGKLTATTVAMNAGSLASMISAASASRGGAAPAPVSAEMPPPPDFDRPGAMMPQDMPTTPLSPSEAMVPMAPGSMPETPLTPGSDMQPTAPGAEPESAALAPAPAAPGGKIPWVQIGIGAGVLALAGAFFAFRKPGGRRRAAYAGW